MNLLSAAHYTAFLLYVYLIFFVIAKNPRASLNRVCALLIGCFAIWSLGSTFFYAAVSKNNALIWFNISALGGCSFASFYLWFSLKLTGKDKLLKKWYFYAPVFFIPLFFNYQHWTGNLAYITKQSYGFTIIWPISTWALPFYVYYLSASITSIYLIYKFGKCSRFLYERKQAKLIVSLSVISLTVGSMNVIILPLLKIFIIPSMGSITPLIWLGGIAYAITKYKLMVLTPAYAAADILSTMSDSLILVGPDGKILDANTATLKLLGYSREELINQPVQILLASREASLLKEMELQEQLSQINTFKNYHMFYRAKNGVEIPMSISGSVLRDQDHNLIGIVGVARDQSEILRLQSNEHAYMVEKARTEALEERARELQAAYDKLKTFQNQLIQSEKMAAVGQLAGGVAHEINNPMGVILGFAQSISKRINETHPLYTPLKSIEREAERCKKLVMDLLAFSRTGKTNPEIIDINTAIDETLSLIEAQAKLKQIELIKEYEPDLPRVTAHKNQLQQVIMNLCANAINIMPSGVLTITTKHIRDHIEISIKESQLGGSKEAGEEVNLGLSLCREIIRKHQGVIEVESETGNGTRFTIKLPINEQ